MEEKNKNIIEKALAILNRQPMKLETLIQAERESAALLSRIREVWRRLFGIDVDAKRRAYDKKSLGNHLKEKIFQEPTPLIDALMAEIDATPKAESEQREYERSPITVSTEPGVTQADVFRVFGPSTFKWKDLVNCREVWPRVLLTDADWQEVAENDRREILEAAAKWNQEKTEDGVTCPHCGDDPHAKIVKRTWANGKFDWMCHRCGRTVLVANKILIT